jgi:hypothetical protein
MFVLLTVKAVNIELISDLTSSAFIAALRLFASRRDKPSLIWSDHGTNFVGADSELKEIVEFLEQQVNQDAMSKFCSTQNIQWQHIPERLPNFGGLREAAVKKAQNFI